MPIPPEWDVTDAIKHRSIIPFQGPAWRIHRRHYRADDPGGSLRVSGRFHRGLDIFHEDQIWAALYLALSPEIALAELMRHITPAQLPALNSYSLTRLELEVTEVVDLCDSALLGLKPEELHHDTSYEITQGLGRAAYEIGAEGILVPSATNLGNNLVVFPTHLRRSSTITIVESRHPRLYVNRKTDPDS